MKIPNLFRGEQNIGMGGGASGKDPETVYGKSAILESDKGSPYRGNHEKRVRPIGLRSVCSASPNCIDDSSFEASNFALTAQNNLPIHTL